MAGEGDETGKKNPESAAEEHPKLPEEVPIVAPTPAVTERNRRLTVLDTKCSALLRLSSFIIVLVNISWQVLVNKPLITIVLGGVVLALFTGAICHSLKVIRLDWNATDQTVVSRTEDYTYAYRYSIFGLFATGLFIVTSAIAAVMA